MAGRVIDNERAWVGIGSDVAKEGVGACGDLRGEYEVGLAADNLRIEVCEIKSQDEGGQPQSWSP